MKTASSTSAGARLLPDRKGHCWYALVHEIWHACMFHEHCFRREHDPPPIELANEKACSSRAGWCSSAHRSRVGGFSWPVLSWECRMLPWERLVAALGAAEAGARALARFYWVRRWPLPHLPVRTSLEDTGSAFIASCITPQVQAARLREHARSSAR